MIKQKLAIKVQKSHQVQNIVMNSCIPVKAKKKENMFSDYKQVTSCLGK